MKLKRSILCGMMAAAVAATSVTPAFAVKAEDIYIEEDFNNGDNEAFFDVKNGKFKIREWSSWSQVALKDGAARYFYLTNSDTGRTEPNVSHGNFDSNKSGELMAEYRFSVEKLHNDVTYMPIGFSTDDKGDSYAKSIKNIYVKGAALYGTDNPSAYGQTTTAATQRSIDDYNKTAKKICDITPNTWYSVKELINIDGDSSTFDTYSVCVKNESTGEEVIMKNFCLGLPLGSWQPTKYNLTDLCCITMGYIDAGTAVEDANDQSYAMSIDDIKIYKPETSDKADFIKFTVSSSISDGATEVQDSELKFTFSTAISASEAAKVKLYKNAGGFVDSGLIGSLSDDGLTLTFSGLAGRTSYKAVVPSDMTSVAGGNIEAEKVITFTTAMTYIINENADRGQNNSWWQGGEFAYNWKGSWSFGDDANGGKYIMFKNTGSDAPEWRYNTLFNKSGNIVMEGKFMIPVSETTNGEGVFPLGFSTDVGEDSNHGMTRTVYAKNGKFMVVTNKPGTTTGKTGGTYTELEICDIDPEKWYTIRVTANVDGNAETFDSFYYNITDGTSTYTGGPYPLGALANRWTGSGERETYEMTQIKRFYFALPYESGTSIAADDLKVYYAEPLTAEISIADSATNVSVSDDITVTFNKAIPLSDTEKITLSVKKDGAFAPCSVTRVLSEDGKTVTISGEMEYGKEYKISVPKSIASTEGNAIDFDKEVTFATETMPKGIEISNVVINDGAALDLTEGKTVKVSATFTNKGIKTEQSGCLIVGIFNSQGELQAIAYSVDALKLNASKTINATMSVPRGIGTGASLKIYAWDSIKSMTAMSEVTDIQ